MHTLLELLLGIFSIAPTTTKPAPRDLPARWRTVALLWVVLAAAIPVGGVLSSVAPGTRDGVIVALVMAAAGMLVLTVSCAEVALGRRRRGTASGRKPRR